MSTEEIQSLHTKLDEIHVALVGNPAMGHKGLVCRVEAVEQEVAAHSRKLVWATGAIAGIVLAFDWAKSKLFGG